MPRYINADDFYEAKVKTEKIASNFCFSFSPKLEQLKGELE